MAASAALFERKINAMHAHHLSTSLQNGLGFYYLLVAGMNVGFAAFFWTSLKNFAQAVLWLAVGGLFRLHAVAYFAHLGWVIPEVVQHTVNYVMNPVTYFVAACAGLFVVLYCRKF